MDYQKNFNSVVVNYRQNLSLQNIYELRDDPQYMYIPLDNSVLANPFKGCNSQTYNAYRWWLWENIKLHQEFKGADNVLLQGWINKGLEINENFSNPTVNMVTKRLLELTTYIKQGRKIKFICFDQLNEYCYCKGLINCLLWIIKED